MVTDDDRFIDFWVARSQDTEHQKMYDAARDMLPNLSGAHFLDVGGCNGELTARVISAGASHVSLLDLSDHALSAAEQNLSAKKIDHQRASEPTGSKVTLIQANAETIAHPSEKYTHAAWILPSKAPDFKATVDEVAQILFEKYNHRGRFETVAEAKAHVSRIINSPKPDFIDGFGLQQAAQDVYFRRVFRNTMKGLQHRGYFLVMDYCHFNYPILSGQVRGDPFLEEQTTISNRTKSFGFMDQEPAYGLVDSKFIYSAGVYADCDLVNKKNFNPVAPPKLESKFIFQGVVALLLRKGSD